MIVFDAYERQTRLAPGLMTLLPLSFALVALGLDEAPVISGLGSLLIAAGGPLVLTNTVRNRGRRLEAILYREWGGTPTTQLLRLSTPSTNELARDRHRQILAEATGLPLPSLDAEQSSQAKTDETYEVMTTTARERTRRVALVQAENRSYGFHRNLLGMNVPGHRFLLRSRLGLTQGDADGEAIEEVG